MGRRNNSAYRAGMGRRSSNVRQSGMSRSNFLRGLGLAGAGAGMAAMGFGGIGRAQEVPEECLPVVDGFNATVWRESIDCGFGNYCVTLPFPYNTGQYDPYAGSGAYIAFPVSFPFNFPSISSPGEVTDQVLLNFWNRMEALPLYAPMVEFIQKFGAATAGVHQTPDFMPASVLDMHRPIDFLQEDPVFAYLEPRTYNFEAEVSDTPWSKLFKIYGAGLLHAPDYTPNPCLPPACDPPVHYIPGYVYNGITGLLEHEHYELVRIDNVLPDPPYPPQPAPPYGAYPYYVPYPIVPPGVIDYIFNMLPQIPRKVKVRGWYIQGDGLKDNDTGVLHHPVIFYVPGITRAIAHPENRFIAAYLVSQGFDVLMMDKRGHGFSEDPNQSIGNDVFEVLDQLGSQSGCKTFYPGDTGPQNRTLLPDTPMDTEVVLMGFSQGAAILAKAMAMNYNAASLPINTKYYPDGSIDQTPQPSKGYNFKGFVDCIGWASGPYYNANWAFLALQGFGISAYVGNALCDGNVYNTMGEWPAYFDLKMSQDLNTPYGSVDVFNNKIRGFKELILLDGFHGDNFVGDNILYMANKAAKWAKKVIFNTPPSNNMAKTSIDQAVCQMPKANDNGKGKLGGQALATQNILKQFLPKY